MQDTGNHAESGPRQEESDDEKRAERDEPTSDGCATTSMNLVPSVDNGKILGPGIKKPRLGKNKARLGNQMVPNKSSGGLEAERFGLRTMEAGSMKPHALRDHGTNMVANGLPSGFLSAHQARDAAVVSHLTPVGARPIKEQAPPTSNRHGLFVTLMDGRWQVMTTPEFPAGVRIEAGPGADGASLGAAYLAQIKLCGWKPCFSVEARLLDSNPIANTVLTESGNPIDMIYFKGNHYTVNATRTPWADFIENLFDYDESMVPAVMYAAAAPPVFAEDSRHPRMLRMPIEEANRYVMPTKGNLHALLEQQSAETLQNLCATAGNSITVVADDTQPDWAVYACRPEKMIKWVAEEIQRVGRLDEHRSRLAGNHGVGHGQ